MGGTFEPLRSKQSFTANDIEILQSSKGHGNYLPGLKGDALEIIATFSTVGTTAESFGLSLRVGENFSCSTGYDLTRRSIAPINWPANIVEQPLDQVELHVFLDRSIIETYTAGAAATTRCLLPSGVAGSQAQGVDL